MEVANILAYYLVTKTTALINFIVQAPNGRLKEDLARWPLGACAIKLIMAVIVAVL